MTIFTVDDLRRALARLPGDVLVLVPTENGYDFPVAVNTQPMRQNGWPAEAEVPVSVMQLDEEMAYTRDELCAYTHVPIDNAEMAHFLMSHWETCTKKELKELLPQGGQLIEQLRGNITTLLLALKATKAQLARLRGPDDEPESSNVG